jgi:hypothetical protein
MLQIDTTPLPSKHASSGWTWRLHDRGDVLELTPRLNLALLSLELGFGILLWLGGYWFITRVVCVNQDDDWMPVVWLVAIPAMLAFACVMRYVDYRFGPRFVVDRMQQSLTLPKLNRTWKLGDVLGWQLLEYVKESGSDKNRMSQIVLVVQSVSGPERILLVEGVGKSIARRFEQLMSEIERTTGMRRLG